MLAEPQTSIEATMRAHAYAVRERLRNPVRMVKPEPAPVAPVAQNAGYTPVRVTNRPYSIKWREIVATSAVRHGLTERDLLSPDRSKGVVQARAEAMWLMANCTDMTLPAIGKRFGRDHTTVLYCLRKYGAEIEARFDTTASEPKR